MQQQQLLFLRQMQLMYEESLLLQAHPGNISQNISKEALPGKRWLLKKMSTVLFEIDLRFILLLRSLIT